MRKRYIILGAVLAVLLCICPAAADDAAKNYTISYLHTPVEGHPLGLTLYEIRTTVEEIVQDKTLRPDEKLQAQTETFGMDARLKAYLDAEKDLETGEPIYPDNIPILTPILDWLGIWDATPEEPYNKEQGEAAYSLYLSTFVSEYKPTGDFGGPIQ